jgi:AraC family transcriptional regulator, ethanolamine operon transcriptional activator
MPTRTSTFSSFEAYLDAIQSANLRALFKGPKCRDWVLSHLAVNNLRFQWGQSGGSSVIEGSVVPGGVGVFMLSQTSELTNGNAQRFDDRSLMVLRPGEEFCIAATGCNQWFSVFIPNEVLAEWSGTPLAIKSPSAMIRIPSSRAERFRLAMERLAFIVRNAPTAFDSSAALNMTAHKLAQTVREALGSDMEVTRPRGRREVPRKQVIRKAMDFVDQRTGDCISVQDLATGAGVSERTLRNAFQDYYRIGPVRFLKLRTLHQARRALTDSDRSVTTVTEIATRFGVWDFGRFARDYRVLFGEHPSETLRR